MSDHALASGGPVPLADLKHIDTVCDRFERAWQSDDRPDLGSFLADDPGDGPALARLFFNLLALELEFRLARGETLDAQAYLARFPEHATAIPAVFASVGIVDKSLRSTGQGSAPSPGNSPGTTPTDEQHWGALPEAELSSAALESLRAAGYEIVGELGRGGMGVVYLARKLALNRPCALKMILAGRLAGAAATARFRTEAEAVARLRHPGIVQIYHVGDAGGLPFLELEYLAGGSLDRALAGTPRPVADAVRLVEALSLAIAEAHAKGIVHRDLKPANVLLDAEGSPKIADFGLAKVLDSDSDLTRTQTVLGSPSYMAPEQAEGSSHLAGAATDVYALGAILYTLLTGGPPFRAATALETLAQVKSVDPVPPSRLQPGLPRDLETICLKCLEKAPGRRYARAVDLAEDLRRYRTGEPILARPASARERAWKWARRRPTVAASLAVSATALGLMLGGIIYYDARLQTMLQRTQVAERAAVDRGKLVIDAYRRLVSDVQEKLGDTAETRSIRQSLLTTAIQGLDAASRTTHATVPDLSMAVAHQKMGEILRQVGRVDDAGKQFEQAIQLAETIDAAMPGNLQVAECLRDACLGLGELILRDERPRDAVTYFRRAVQQAEAIATVEPDRAGARRGLIEGDHHLGRALEASNELAEAEDRFRAMNERAAMWAADEPASSHARDLLASSHLRLARVRWRRNDLVAASADYEKAITIALVLATEHPKSLEYKSHLALALVESGIFALDGREYAQARPLLERSERLYSELTEADPEDRENQVWLVHTLLQYGRLERDEDHFAKAEANFRRALDRLRQLDRDGKLEGRPAFKFRHMKVLGREIAYCAAAPHVLDDVSVARSPIPYVTIRLLWLRAKRLADQGRHAELAATVEALCALEDGDGDDQYALARALASCVKYDDGRPTARSEPGVAALGRRCTDRAVAALTRAFDRGFPDVFELEIQIDLDPIREDPGFRALVAQLKGRRIQETRQEPVH